jgi:hypothetical protein
MKTKHNVGSDLGDILLYAKIRFHRFDGHASGGDQSWVFLIGRIGPCKIALHCIAHTYIGKDVLEKYYRVVWFFNRRESLIRLH